VTEWEPIPLVLVFLTPPHKPFKKGFFEHNSMLFYDFFGLFNTPNESAVNVSISENYTKRKRHPEVV